MERDVHASAIERQRGDMSHEDEIKATLNKYGREIDLTIRDGKVIDVSPIRLDPNPTIDYRTIDQLGIPRNDVSQWVDRWHSTGAAYNNGEMKTLPAPFNTWIREQIEAGETL